MKVIHRLMIHTLVSAIFIHMLAPVCHVNKFLVVVADHRFYHLVRVFMSCIA